ncbi:MAG TPA: Crp/Fnr family transcriptional regulator [Rhizomicrobium sp.]
MSQPAFDSKSLLARVGEGRSIAKFAKNQVVFSQGDFADAIFYLQKGKAKVTVVSEQGKEAVVSMLGADEFFGEGCLAGQSQRIATVTTMTDSSIMRLDKAAMIRLLHEDSVFAEMFMAHVSQEMLAEMIGTTRSRVSFFMNKFRDLGFIDYNGGIKVHSSLLNIVLHDQAKDEA